MRAYSWHAAQMTCALDIRGQRMLPAGIMGLEYRQYQCRRAMVLQHGTISHASLYRTRTLVYLYAFHHTLVDWQNREATVSSEQRAVAGERGWQQYTNASMFVFCVTYPYRYIFVTMDRKASQKCRRSGSTCAVNDGQPGRLGCGGLSPCPLRLAALQALLCSKSELIMRPHMTSPSKDSRR